MTSCAASSRYGAPGFIPCDASTSCGVRSGTLCRVFLRGANGARVPAGTFRYRYGDDSQAVLSSALDLSRTAAIGVRAGSRTFIAPVDQSGATTDNSTQEDNT